MQIVEASSKTIPKRAVFRSDTDFVYSHAFFVIGGNLPAGNFEIKSISDEVAEGKYAPGWICDIWNKNVKFGPVKEILKNDSLYNLKSWKTVSIRDVTAPEPVWSAESVLKKYDFFLNLSNFIRLIYQNKTLLEKMDVDETHTRSEEEIIHALLDICWPEINSTFTAPTQQIHIHARHTAL